jgi:DNA-directed RNA polymerase subunit RPC12/RpoP
MDINKVRQASKAMEAYEKAVIAAQEMIAQGGLVHGLGATVMVGRLEPWIIEPTSYVCAECSANCHTSGAKDWKFCPYCGAEILRWDRGVRSGAEPVKLNLEVEEPKRKRGAR